MEMAGMAAGGAMRSDFNEWEITNAAELEAHINMNATAAKINFDKYYQQKMETVSSTWKDHKRRLDVNVPFDVPVIVVDCGVPLFDYATLPVLFSQRLEERKKAKEERDMLEEVGEKNVNLFVDMRVDQTEPLKLKLVGVDYSNVDKVVAVLKDNKEITRLEISGCGLEADDMDAMATWIQSDHSMTSLDLSGNKLGTDGVKKVLDALAAHPKITELDLGANELTKSAAKEVGAFLKGDTTLKKLALSGNKLGIYGPEDLINAGLNENRTLQTLSLQNNSLGEDGMKNFVKLFPDPPVVVGDAPPAEGCFNFGLIQVNIAGNKCDNDTYEKTIAAACAYNECLQQLQYMTAMEEGERTLRLGEIEKELKLLELLERKSHAELEEKLKSSKKAAGTGVNAAKALASPPGKAGAKKTPSPPAKPSAAPGKKGPAPSGGKAPAPAGGKAPAPSGGKAPAPAGSKAVAGAGGKGAKAPSPKKPAGKK